MRVKNKRTVITAAASGMGLAGARLFAREGARLVLVDVNRAALNAVVKELAAKGCEVTGIVADLSDLNQPKRIVHEASQRLGGLDILWNHAGISCPVDIENLNLADYDRANAINVTAGLLAAGQAARLMADGGGGSIVFTASTAGLVGSAWSPIYSGQKFAVVGMVMSLAQRFAKDRIRVNALCPGPTNTPMLPTFFVRPGETLTPEALSDRIKTSVAAAVPLGRPGEPEEIAHGALWLASDDASFVTGIALPVDGGYTCR
ncbi:MAG: SDR family oxidoreductase [Pseudomonadota bacterium]|nr:SDR family oxidoreductase [Pseudomonadota bacterium]